MKEEHQHTYDPELYDFLKKEYKIDKDKVRCIKLGMNKYGLSMKQVKEVVDFIADEIYEKEAAQAKEEINSSTEEIEEYRFSFPQYFIHKLMWKLLLLSGLELVLYEFIKNGMGLEIIVAFYANIIAILVILYPWAIASTSVFRTTGKLEYVYRTPIFSNQRHRSHGWTCYHYYNIKRVDAIKETPFSFVIYGKIESRVSELYAPDRENCVYISKKLKLTKMFKKQRVLLRKIEPKRIRK